MSSLNVFEIIDEYYDFDRTDKHKCCYGRVQNHTVRILKDKIAVLEHGVGALAFASGMAAETIMSLIHTVCLFLVAQKYMIEGLITGAVKG